MKFLSRLLYYEYSKGVAKYILWVTYNYDNILKHNHVPGYLPYVLPYDHVPKNNGNDGEVWKKLHAFQKR